MYAFSNTNLDLKTHNKGSHVILNSYHPIFVPIRDIHHHTVCNIPCNLTYIYIYDHALSAKI